ncbi:MAG: hypothetical protein AABM29_09080 [Actinomycetota bacterium]
MGIVPQKNACRHCGATVKPLHRCPRCGRRAWNIAALFAPWWMR